MTTRKAPAGAPAEERDVPDEGLPDSRLQYRDATIALDRAAFAKRMAERAEGAEEEGIPICFSSEQAVMRYDWWAGERYLEVLDHDARSVDMSYAQEGLPFLMSHALREQVGIVENITIDADRRARGVLRMSKSARGREVLQDVLDGIRKKVSFGYDPGDTYEQTGGEKEGEIPTRRYKRWTPMEVSDVAVPADVTVGYGRGARAGAPGGGSVPRANPAAPKAEEPLMSGQSGAAPNGGAGTITPGEDRAKDFVAILDMCRKAKLSEKETDEIIKAGLTPDQAGRRIFDVVVERQKSFAANPPLDLAPSDQREFILGRAIKAMGTGDWKEAGYEREISSALGQALGRGSERGILVPTWGLTQLREEAITRSKQGGYRGMQVRTPHTVGVAGQGGNTVFTTPGPFVELLRNRSSVLSLNPLMLTGLQGNLALPRQTAAGTAFWRAENPGSDATESNMTFDQIVLSPKNILGTQAYTRQLFAQSVIAIDTLIRNDLSRILALLFDLGCLHGTGGANDVTGIYTLAGINSVAFGGTVTYAKVVDMESAIEADNAAISAMAYVATPETKGKAKQTQKFSGTNGEALWLGGLDGEMNGYRAVATNQLAKNLGAGTNEHGIVLGAWGESIVADWGAIEFIVDQYTKARQAIVNITAHWLADFDVRYAECFAKGTGLIP